MVTAESKTDNVIAARKAGVNNYIVKPFNAQTLRTKIEAVEAPAQLHIFSSSILQENAPWRQSADRLQFFSPTWWACLGAPPPAPLWRSAFLLSTIAQPTPTL
jgi:CheY-like chemotaxis protein